ncbi:MAG TPA: ABC transporter permease, partial [Fibrobacteraceae bacterium]|nr:ABC transporter permease [Fibrobacteraceae bacterium]
MLKKYPTARYILFRGGWYFLTFLVAIVINFTLPRLGDRNPVDIMMAKASQGLSDEVLQEKREGFEKEFGLIKVDGQGTIIRDDKGQAIKTSSFDQFVNYLKMTLQGDLGISIQKYPKKVIDIIVQAVPWTIALQLPTILLGWIVGNLLGALAAYRRGVFDKVIFPMALFMSSVPFFVFGMVLVYIFAVVLGWFPAMGAYSGDLIPNFSLEFIGSMGYHYILPFLSIFLILAGGQAIGMRSMGIYELGTDYIKYAKWLGLKENKVLMYLFRNAMLPQLTGLALSIGQMVGGALITEMIFSYPGLGMAMLNAINANDYTVIQG